MLRVYGITYDHTVNYGSCFQAYALQRAIEDICLEDDSRCEYKLIPIRTFKEWSARHKLTLRRFLILVILGWNRLPFRRFEKKYMHFAPLHSQQELIDLNQVGDVFVCGSDVIWNPDINEGTNAFYLDFANKYKFSYAASFGKSEVDNKSFALVSAYINALNAISVREKSSEEILKKCVEKPVRIVADPVFLLHRSEWEDTFVGQNTRGKYIFVYITYLSEVVQSFLRTLHKATGLKIVYAAYAPKQALKQGMLQVQTPEKWLQLLHDAEYVVTNSFHATAFSVLFHKKFFTVVNGDKSKGINVRMNDFLTAVGLEDRIFTDIPAKLNLSDIDYTDVDRKISSMREDSLQFLQQNLEAAYQQRQFESEF